MAHLAPGEQRAHHRRAGRRAGGDRARDPEAGDPLPRGGRRRRGPGELFALAAGPGGRGAGVRPGGQAVPPGAGRTATWPGDAGDAAAAHQAGRCPGRAGHAAARRPEFQAAAQGRGAGRRPWTAPPGGPAAAVAAATSTTGWRRCATVLAAVGLSLCGSPRASFWSLVWQRVLLRLRGLGYRRRRAERDARRTCWRGWTSATRRRSGWHGGHRSRAPTSSRGRCCWPWRPGSRAGCAGAGVGGGHESIGGTAARRRTELLLAAADELADGPATPYRAASCCWRGAWPRRWRATGPAGAARATGPRASSGSVHRRHLGAGHGPSLRAVAARLPWASWPRCARACRC